MKPCVPCMFEKKARTCGDVHVHAMLKRSVGSEHCIMFLFNGWSLLATLAGGCGAKNKKRDLELK